MPVKTITPETWKKLMEEHQKEMDALYEHRTRDIVALYGKSWSMAHIARKWGITRERVWKILEGAGALS